MPILCSMGKKGLSTVFLSSNILVYYLLFKTVIEVELLSERYIWFPHAWSICATSSWFWSSKQKNYNPLNGRMDEFWHLFIYPICRNFLLNFFPTITPIVPFYMLNLVSATFLQIEEIVFFFLRDKFYNHLTF